MGYCFSYLAKNQKGEVVQSKIEASDIEAAKKDLRAQGLEVESIHLVFGQTAVSPQPKAVVAQQPLKVKVQEPLKAQEPEKPASQPVQVPARLVEKSTSTVATPLSVLPKPVLQTLLGLGILVIVLAFVIIPRSLSFRKSINKNIAFQISRVDDLSEDKVTRKYFYLVVPQEITEDEVKYVAQKVYNQEKKRDKTLAEAMFDFFYKGQDLMIHTPIAVVRFNWKGSKQWEYSFSFDRGQTGNNVELVQTGLIPGQEVQYKVTLSKNIKVDGAQKIVGLKMFDLNGQWEGKVKRIKAICIYEDFFEPFMMCELDVGKAASLKNIDCEFLKEK